jgi:OmcA/MtrC family decaheme c-type cytochrome
MPAESVHFKYMIHKIHRGADLENGYVAYGFGNREHDYSEIHFTGDLRNCDKCHVDNSQQLPLPAGRLATVTPTGFMEFMEPETAACLSCHDGFGAAAHAAANTGSLGETCATCHGEDKAFSVDYLHAR